MTGVLVTGYDLVIFDLDGVLVLGTEAVAGAPEAVARLRAEGCRLAYATNNASRSRTEVAGLLGSLGIPAEPDEVVTSASATARLLAERLPAGSPVLVVGAPALAGDIDAAGLKAVFAAGDRPVAVVQGYGPEVGWADLAEASVAIRAGASWYATNADRTLPSPRGPLPGNGSLVAALATALDRQPELIVGKPDPALFVEAARRVGADRPLVVGDRIDTDIEGANRAGMDSLLVLTGVSTPADLLAAADEQRPTYVAEDLVGLWADADELRLSKDRVPVTHHGWTVGERDGRWELAGDGRRLDALRALAGASWRGARSVGADGDAARKALAELGLEQLP